MNFFWVSHERTAVLFLMIMIWVWNANYLAYFIYSNITLKTIKKQIV